MGLRRRNLAHTRLFVVPAAPEQAAPARPRPSPGERHAMIARAAYARAEALGFRTDPLLDWLAAEREVDAELAQPPHAIG